MKKIAKIAVGITLAASLAATAGALAGCGDAGKTGEAYALTHGTNRFIGYSKVTVKGDKVTDVVLTEVDLPTQLTNTDKTIKYAVVSYGSVTMTYDAEGKTYKVGSQTITEFFQNEANCKAYYEAAIAGNIKGAATAEGEKVTITKAELSKEENGYWTVNPKEDENFTAYSQWKWNRDQTVKYVKEKGVDGLNSLTKGETKVTLPNGAEKPVWVDGNNVSTGATWNDLGSNPEANTYTSYAQLIVKAYNAAK